MAIKLKKDAFVKNLIKGYKFANHLDNVIGKYEFEWEAKFEIKKGDDAWHPSGDCVPSPSVLYEKVTTESNTKPSVSLRKTFAVGHFWHAYIQHITVELLEFASWDEVERPGTTRWGDKPYQWAQGKADIAPCHIPGFGDTLVDIKTMGSHDFKQNGLPGWCAGKYEAQVNVYMDWFDLDKAIVLCVSKDTPHDFKEFLFERNDALIDTIYAKWHYVGDCLEANEPPDEDYEIGFTLPFVGPKP